MLLVCCWRTLKEISLFFGDIIKNMEIEGENENYLLTSKRVSFQAKSFIGNSFFKKDLFYRFFLLEIITSKIYSLPDT
jgi:hypothetical protein